LAEVVLAKPAADALRALPPPLDEAALDALTVLESDPEAGDAHGVGCVACGRCGSDPSGCCTPCTTTQRWCASGRFATGQSPTGAIPASRSTSNPALTDVLVRDRVMYADDQPVQLATS